jgi:hypothetical protein
LRGERGEGKGDRGEGRGEREREEGRGERGEGRGQRGKKREEREGIYSPAVIEPSLTTLVRPKSAIFAIMSLETSMLPKILRSYPFTRLSCLSLFNKICLFCLFPLFPSAAFLSSPPLFPSPFSHLDTPV